MAGLVDRPGEALGEIGGGEAGGHAHVIRMRPPRERMHLHIAPGKENSKSLLQCTTCHFGMPSDAPHHHRLHQVPTKGGGHQVPIKGGGIRS
eukprot:2144567-Pyramimonas_sp.AAC.1